MNKQKEIEYWKNRLAEAELMIQKMGREGKIEDEEDGSDILFDWLNKNVLIQALGTHRNREDLKSDWQKFKASKQKLNTTKEIVK